MSPNYSTSLSMNDHIANVIDHSDRLISNLAIVMAPILSANRPALKNQGCDKDINIVFIEIGLSFCFVPLEFQLERLLGQ